MKAIDAVRSIAEHITWGGRHLAMQFCSISCFLKDQQNYVYKIERRRKPPPVSLHRVDAELNFLVLDRAYQRFGHCHVAVLRNIWSEFQGCSDCGEPRPLFYGQDGGSSFGISG